MSHRIEIENAIQHLKNHAFPFTVSLLESYLNGSLKLWALNQAVSDSYGGWTDSTQTVAIYIDKETAEKAAFDNNLNLINEQFECDGELNIGLGKAKITYPNGTRLSHTENCIMFLRGEDELHADVLMALTTRLGKHNPDAGKEFVDKLHNPAVDVDKIRQIVGSAVSYLVGSLGCDWFAEYTVEEMRTS